VHSNSLARSSGCRLMPRPSRPTPAACRSWEEERASLLAQLEALQREGRRRTRPAGGQEGGAAGAGGSCGEEAEEVSLEAELASLRAQLTDAREKEVRQCFAVGGAAVGGSCSRLLDGHHAALPAAT
jgi:hypothetical protein